MARYQHQDRFYRKANELGLPSRSAFKLEELLTRFKLVKEGGRVIDVGCAPGGWLAILGRVVGKRGRVIGVDLASCSNAASNVFTMAGDVTDAKVRLGVAEAIDGAADLVTSDLAPKLSGIAERDQAKLRELLEAVLDLAQSVLKPGGAMIAKVFMGPGFEEIRELFTKDFARVEIVRTRASRPGSSELFLIARGFQNRRG
jgi:23S rRNA (uridine2552-2'-O)-methyltransferase